MKFFYISLIFFLLFLSEIKALPISSDTFRWDRITYVNLSVGEKYTSDGQEVELLALKNHFNKIRVGKDTAWLKVNYRSPASYVGNLRLFVADNRHVKEISPNPGIHGLLKKDALIAFSKATDPMADKWRYAFPVSFTEGYIWKNDEDSYIFSLMGSSDPKPGKYKQLPGLAMDMNSTGTTSNHAVVAMESGKVMWIENRISDSPLPVAAICIESGSSPGIYYVYRNLYNKDIFVNRNQQVERGDALGYVYGVNSRGNLFISVIRSDSVPSWNRCEENIVNFFPFLIEIYYGSQFLQSQTFTKGQINFGKSYNLNGNVKNVSAFEEYQGTGWKLDKWNTADKVEWVSNLINGNARLAKVLFEGMPAHCTNPNNWFDYEINVKNGIYRIRSLMGDCFRPSWQKVEYEGVIAGTYKLNKGEFTWTPEKIVRVRDGKLTVRIYLSEENMVAGISEIVFQKAD